MRRRVVLALAALAAAMLIAAAAGTASASRLSVSERSFRVVWRPFTFIYGFEEIRRVECNITLEGSFSSSTFAKTRGRIGSVQRASFASCAVTPLAETLPWGIQYERFSGPLPNIWTVTIGFTGVRLLVNELGCLASSETATPWTFNIRLEAGVITGIAADETNLGMPLTGLCEARNLRYQGLGAFTPPGGTGRVSLSLI